MNPRSRLAGVLAGLAAACSLLGCTSRLVTVTNTGDSPVEIRQRTSDAWQTSMTLQPGQRQRVEIRKHQTVEAPGVAITVH